MEINIKPLGDRVIVEQDEAETISPGGIYIPAMAQEKPKCGTIVAVGPGKFSEALKKIKPIPIKVGDRVMYGKHVGTEITYNNKEYLIMFYDDMYAVI